MLFMKLNDRPTRAGNKEPKATNRMGWPSYVCCDSQLRKAGRIRKSEIVDGLSKRRNKRVKVLVGLVLMIKYTMDCNVETVLSPSIHRPV